MKFHVHKLGCPKNDVDADYIAARLIADGHQHTSNAASAETVIVNTCGFIQAAKEESIEAILQLAQLKQNGSVKRVYAAGCLSQRYGDELLREMPELDGAFGHGALESLAESVATGGKRDRAVRMESRRLAYLDWKDRFISDGFPYAYLKISDGCDRACTYCAIPAMRGHFRSRPMKSIVNEARFLAENGKKELILVSQEATLYGQGLKNRPDILELLRELEQIEGVEWIRLMYLYPAQLSEPLIEYMCGDNKTLPYFDLPLQHVNSRILADMHRQIDTRGIERLLRLIRSYANATIRTTFIVGFPGESEDEFEELKEAVAEWQFDRMGVFPYSAEEGTPAAERTDQVSEDVKSERVESLMELQQGIALRANGRLVNTVTDVIIDAVSPDGSAIGRTAADCPDIDCEVEVTGDNLNTGQLRPVRIEAVSGYDLVGVALAE